MDWLQFWSSILTAWAWPAAAIILGLMFREQVRKLLDKMKSLKAPGIEAAFTEEVAKVTEVAKVVQAEAVAAGGEQIQGLDHPAPQEESDKLWALLKERPSALILDAWRDVEKVVFEVIAELGLQVSAVQRRNAPPTLWPSMLQKHGLLSHEEAALIVDLRSLRNKVAHATDFEPTVDDAMDYYRTASLVVNVLRKKLAETKALKQ